MDTVPGLAKLQERKRELLLESELNRQILSVEVRVLSFRAGRLKRGFGFAQNSWKWAVLVAGFLLARKLTGKKMGVFAWGSMIVYSLQGAWKIWEMFQQKRPDSDTRA